MKDPTEGWAKAVEAASNATSDGVVAASSFGKFLSPLFRPLIGIAGDHLEVLRTKRQVRLAERLQEFLKERGLSGPTREIAPAFLIPLIERASIEFDDDMQDVWATMLVNAVDSDSGTERRTAFVAMLDQMAPFDVLILSKLFVAYAEMEWSSIETHELPESATIRDESKRSIAAPRDDVEVALGNLSRLGCLHPASAIGGMMNYGVVRLTKLGISFIKACSRPPANK